MRFPLYFLTLFALFAILAACTPTSTYYRVPSTPAPKIDAQAWERLMYTADDLASSSLREGLFSLKPIRFQGEGEYRLQVDYWGDDWLLIPPGPSLRLTIDGREVVLSSLGSSGGRGVRTVSAFARRYERAEYPVSLDVLRQLSEANLVGVRLSGSRTLERIFDRDDLERFVTFYVQANMASQP